MSHDVPVLDPDDVLRKWAEVAPLIQRLQQRTSNSPDEFPVQDGSSLAADDEASQPYNVSHVVVQCLNAAVDHMHAVKTLVIDQQVLHYAATWTLSRGALETLVAAYWVLGPAERGERVERALRWYAKGFRDQHTAVDEYGLANGTLEEHLAKIDVVARRNGLDPKHVRSGYTSTNAAKYCDDTLTREVPEGVLFPWRLCSGFAHGRLWAYLGATDREVVSTDGGVGVIRLTGNMGFALFPLLAAVHLLTSLLRLYERRARQPQRLWALAVPMPCLALSCGQTVSFVPSALAALAIRNASVIRSGTVVP